MPPNFRRVETQVEARILRSPHVVTFFYGKARTSPASPAANLPISPLIAKPDPGMTTGSAEPAVMESQSMRCLYIETTQLADARRERLDATLGGWSNDTRALIRVRAQDARRPDGGLYFEGVAHAEVGTRRFQVLGWSQSGGSGSTEGSYYVQLGAGN